LEAVITKVEYGHEKATEMRRPRFICSDTLRLLVNFLRAGNDTFGLVIMIQPQGVYTGVDIDHDNTKSIEDSAFIVCSDNIHYEYIAPSIEPRKRAIAFSSSLATTNYCSAMNIGTRKTFTTAKGAPKLSNCTRTSWIVARRKRILARH
jgi:hypothetical protein